MDTNKLHISRVREREQKDASRKMEKLINTKVLGITERESALSQTNVDGID